MGILAWLLLLLASAALATAAQFLLFPRRRETDDRDWIYIAGGGLIGAFTGHAWYPGMGPAVDGLSVLPAAVGLVVGAIVVELIYRLVLRPRRA